MCAAASFSIQAPVSMASNDSSTICLRGNDWANRPREVEIDSDLWRKICHWHGDDQQALDWVQLQIGLFSKRHRDKNSLSQIIASIAFVEMVNPARPSYLFTPARNRADLEAGASDAGDIRAASGGL